MSRETLGADVAAEYARIVAAGGPPGAVSLELARRNLAGASVPAMPGQRPAWARLLAWVVRHWLLVVVLVVVVWAVTWAADHTAELVTIVGWTVAAMFGLAAFMVWTGGGRRRGERHPVLLGLLIGVVAGWLAGRQPRRAKR